MNGTNLNGTQMNQINKMFDSKRKRKSDDGSVLRKNDEIGRASCRERVSSPV